MVIFGICVIAFVLLLWATTANVSIKITGGGTLTNPTANTPSIPSSVLTIQSGITKTGTFQSLDINLSNGTGTGNIDNWYFFEGSLAASTAANVDMKLATNELGVALGATYIKTIILRILSPDGVMKLQCGPGAGGSAISNAWVGSLFNANTDYLTIFDRLIWVNQFGEAVGSTTKILGIYNSSSETVNYDLWILVV